MESKKLSLSCSVSYSSLDKYSGQWKSNIYSGTKNVVSEIPFEFIPGIHLDQEEHKHLIIDTIREIAHISKSVRHHSSNQRTKFLFPTALSIDFTIGSTYNIVVNDVSCPYNRFRNNLTTLTYVYEDIKYDVCIKGVNSISSLPRFMFPECS